MWRRRQFIFTAAGAICAPLIANAQAGLRRIGWLTSQHPDSLTPFLEALRQGLAEQKIPEGTRVEVIYRFGDDQLDRVPGLTAELMAAGVELIMVQGAAAPLVVKMNLPVPVIFITSADPMVLGFAKSLAEPIGNCTGVTFMAFELMGKRLELLKEMMPAIRHVSVVGNPLHAGSQIEKTSSEEVGRRLGIQIDFVPTPTRESIAEAGAALSKRKPDAVSLLADGFAIAHRAAIFEITNTLHIPVISGWPVFAEAGALCTYGPRLPQIYRRVAHYVARILEGRKVSELPVERPSQFELILNQTAARKFGISLSRGILARADEVIG